jgi:uncharacterized membrane protein (UPF0127 family)
MADKRNLIMRHSVFVITLIICASCMAQEPHVTLKGESFIVEVAQTQQERALGLMFRDSLPDDHGMLFIFPAEGRLSFWMKNTRIPLDIFYFNEKLELVSVAEDVRPCRIQQCPSYPSKGLAKYVLELNSGKAEELAATPGDVLELQLE